MTIQQNVPIKLVIRNLQQMLTFFCKLLPPIFIVDIVISVMFILTKQAYAYELCHTLILYHTVSRAYGMLQVDCQPLA